MKMKIAVLPAVTAALIVSAGAHAAYVTDNLVVHLDASDADAAGNPIASSTDWALWHNLTGSGKRRRIRRRQGNDITTAGVGTGVPSDPYAMQFNGTDDGLEFLNLLNLSEESLTYEFWIKADPTMALGVGDRGCLIGEFGGTKNFLQLTTPNCSWLNSGAQFDQWPGAGDASYKQVAGMPMEAWVPTRRDEGRFRAHLLRQRDGILQRDERGNLHRLRTDRRGDWQAARHDPLLQRADGPGSCLRRAPFRGRSGAELQQR